MGWPEAVRAVAPRNSGRITRKLRHFVGSYRQTRVCLSIEFHLPGKCRSIHMTESFARAVTAPQRLFNGTRPACNFRPTSLGFERSGNTEITVFPFSSVEVWTRQHRER